MYSFSSRVRYSEINSKKDLTLPSLLDYLQDCCTFQSEALGIGVDYLEKHHVAWVLSSWQISITRYPVMGEDIRVNTWPYAFKSFYGHRNFSVEDGGGNVVAAANSVWVFMDTEKMRPARITQHIQDIYRSQLGEPLSGSWSERKIPIPENSVEKEPVQVAHFHIDTNHHVNNGKYVLIAEEFLPEGFLVCGLRAEYKKAAVLGDVLYPFVSYNENNVTVTLADENQKPYAVIRFIKDSVEK